MSLESISGDTDIAKYTTLAVTVLLLLERIFKNSKFVLKFGPSGFFCGNRTPPNSPAVSHDQESPATSTPENTPLSDSDMEDYLEFKRWKKRHKKARAKHVHYNKSHESADEHP